MNADDIEDWITTACEADLKGADVDDIEVCETASRLSVVELVKARANLSSWRSPADFRSFVTHLCASCRSADYFNVPSISFLRDAWVISEFAWHKKVHRVRLPDAREQWLDGYIVINGAAMNVEVTSTSAGRKLGDEYRSATKSELDPIDNWVERACAIPGALDKAISDKAAKQYSSPVILVVYLNINECEIRQKETEAVIAAIKERHASSFQEIYILWKDKLL